MITTQVVERLLEADLVVADLSGLNANVFYELAIRHAIFEKPVVHIIATEAVKRMPFDVNQVRAIPYSTDIKGGKQAIKKIVAQIRAWEDGEQPVENPISHAVVVNRLTKSADPVEKAVGELRGAFEELSADFRVLKEHLVAQGGKAGYLPLTFLPAAGGGQPIFTGPPNMLFSPGYTVSEQTALTARPFNQGEVAAHPDPEDLEGDLDGADLDEHEFEER